MSKLGQMYARFPELLALIEELAQSLLDAGPGFGGSCFKKDILNLVYLSTYFGLPEVANYWESVVTLNDWNQSRISKIIVKKLFGTITSKKICILGFAFKANTNDTRESSAINICKDLLEEGAILHIHDPKVSSKQIEIDLKIKGKDKKYSSLKILYSRWNWFYSDNIYDAANDADAIVVLTEWEEYSNINWEEDFKTNEETFLDFRFEINLKW